MDTAKIKELQAAMFEIAFFGPTTAGEKRLTTAMWQHTTGWRSLTVEQLWELYKIYTTEPETFDVYKHTQ